MRDSQVTVRPVSTASARQRVQLADRQNTVAGADRNRCQRAACWTFQHRPSCAIEFTAMGRTDQRRSVPGTDRGSSVGARGRVSDELSRHGLCHNVSGDNDSRTNRHLRLLYLDRVHRGGWWSCGLSSGLSGRGRGGTR